MRFMEIVQKEHFTKAYLQYYHLFKEEKIKFLIENFHINYEPLSRVGIEKFIKFNMLCIDDVLRKKKFLIDSFPEIFRDTFIDINTPIINYYPSYMGENKSPCLFKDLEYDRSFGESMNGKFIFLKTKDRKDLISIWESSLYNDWYCVVKGSVGLIVSQHYIDFSLIEKIVDMI